jgi:hypothetical protein
MFTLTIAVIMLRARLTRAVVRRALSAMAVSYGGIDISWRPFQLVIHNGEHGELTFHRAVLRGWDGAALLHREWRFHELTVTAPRYRGRGRSAQLPRPDRFTVTIGLLRLQKLDLDLRHVPLRERHYNLRVRGSAVFGNVVLRKDIPAAWTVKRLDLGPLYGDDLNSAYCLFVRRLTTASPGRFRLTRAVVDRKGTGLPRRLSAASIDLTGEWSGASLRAGTFPRALTINGGRIIPAQSKRRHITFSGHLTRDDGQLNASFQGRLWNGRPLSLAVQAREKRVHLRLRAGRTRFTELNEILPPSADLRYGSGTIRSLRLRCRLRGRTVTSRCDMPYENLTLRPKRADGTLLPLQSTVANTAIRRHNLPGLNYRAGRSVRRLPPRTSATAGILRGVTASIRDVLRP